MGVWTWVCVGVCGCVWVCLGWVATDRLALVRRVYIFYVYRHGIDKIRSEIQFPQRGFGPWTGANGVYVVSPACPTEFWEGERCGNKEPQNVKIGKASGENGFAAKGKGEATNVPYVLAKWSNSARDIEDSKF